VREDLEGVKFCNTFRVNGFLTGDKDAGLGDIVVGDCEDGVTVPQKLFKCFKHFDCFINI